MEEILKVLKEAEWEPCLHWKAMPTEFAEDSPFDLVSSSGDTTVNPSEWTIHRKLPWDWLVCGLDLIRWLDVCICSTWMEWEWIMILKNNDGGMDLREPARTEPIWHHHLFYSRPRSLKDWLIIIVFSPWLCVCLDWWQGWLGCIHVFRDMAIKVVCLMIGWANFFYSKSL